MILNTKKYILEWNILSDKQKISILLRPISSTQKKNKKIVANIIKNVQLFGDSVLKEYTYKFDNFKLENFYISQENLEQSQFKVSKIFKDSILIAKKNIENFHISQKFKNLNVETYPGVFCQKIQVPINSVGLYVPKGKFPLISTALMLIIPAIIAQCPNIILCSPPPISNELAYVAFQCGITKVLQLGGAQAISALAFGTESIKKVDKIFGPGNVFVTEAKIQVSNIYAGVSIDIPAGPSEVLIISDQFSIPQFIASDLLAQAEHGNNSQVILITPYINIVKQVIIEIKKQILNLNIDTNIFFKKQSKFIIANSLQECFVISNIYAPEHLILHIKNSKKFLYAINNAGSIFLGSWTPESAGDYITGTNHVLPTYGYAKTHSALSVSDFQKNITVQKMHKNSLLKLSKYISVLSEIEGMKAHKNSINVRINYLSKNKNIR